MRRALALVLVLGAGCRFAPARLTGDAPGARDGGADAIDAAASDGPADANAGCLAAWHDGTVQLGAVTLLSVSDSTAVDRDAFLTSDELTLYFSSDRAGGQGSVDPWVAARASLADPFSTPIDQTALASPQGDSKLSMTGDGLYAVFSSSRGGTTGGADLWQATRTSTAMPFGMVKQGDVKMLDTTEPEYDPWISADGKTLYYAPSPIGLPQSIAVATRTSTTMPFASSSPVDELYSGTGDGDPTLSPDQLIIVFSSNRPPPSTSPAAGNLWYAVRAQPDAAFGAPALVPGANSDGNDGDPHLSADGCRLYFSSDRAGTYDLYVATVQP